MPKRAAQGAGNLRKKTVTRSGKEYTFWEGRLTVGTDPGTGKPIRRSFSGQTQKEVREKMQAAAVELTRGTYQTPQKITVSEWCKTWMETFVTGKLKPLTVAAYQGAIDRYITPAIGAIQLQALKGLHVQTMYNAMTAKGLSPKTVKNAGAILRKALSVAIKQGIIQINACDGAEFPKAEQHEIKPLTDEEIPLFLQAIEESPFRNAFALCLFAGLREGECLGLSWRQVDFKNRRITVDQQLQVERKKGAQYYIAPYTKSSKPRTIAPPAIAFEYLSAEKKRQSENRLKAGQMWQNSDDLVFTDEIGSHYSVVNFYKAFKRYAESIGRPDARPHDLRHTAATVAIASGADIKSVQSLLGHATAAFTLNVYAHTSEQMMQDTADRVQGYYESLSRKKQA